MVETSVNAKSNLINLPCEIGEDRIYLALRAWILWLQGLFSTREPGSYRWNPNPTESEIIITGEHPTNTEIVGKRPFVVVGRGPASTMGVSRDQLMQTDMMGNVQIHTDLMQFNVSITCVAREGTEAQALAYFIFRMIPVFKPSLQKIGRLHGINSLIQLSAETGHGQIVPGSSFPEWRSVQLAALVYVQDVISSTKDFYNIIHTVNLHMESNS